VECATPSKWFPWLLVPLPVYENASNIGEGAVNDVGGGGFKARGMEDEEVKVNPEMGQFPLSRWRDPTAVFVVPTFSRKPSTSQRHPHRCLLLPNLQLVPIAMVCDSDISQWEFLMKLPYPTRLTRFHVTEFRGAFL
jgi:hypothetical protein